MEKLLKILKECCPGIDFEAEQHLVTDKVIDSIELVDIISDIEAEFGIVVPMEMVDGDHFDSVDKLWKLILSLQDE